MCVWLLLIDSTHCLTFSQCVCVCVLVTCAVHTSHLLIPGNAATIHTILICRAVCAAAWHFVYRTTSSGSIFFFFWMLPVSAGSKQSASLPWSAHSFTCTPLSISFSFSSPSALFLKGEPAGRSNLKTECGRHTTSLSTFLSVQLVQMNGADCLHLGGWIEFAPLAQNKFCASFFIYFYCQPLVSCKFKFGFLLLSYWRRCRRGLELQSDWRLITMELHFFWQACVCLLICTLISLLLTAWCSGVLEVCCTVIKWSNQFCSSWSSVPYLGFHSCPSPTLSLWWWWCLLIVWSWWHIDARICALCLQVEYFSPSMSSSSAANGTCLCVHRNCIKHTSVCRLGTTTTTTSMSAHYYI